MEALALKTAGDLALQGAGWALATLFGLVIYLLYKEARKDDAVMLGVLSDVKAIIQANTNASTAHALALEGIKSILETRGYAIESLSKQIDGVSKDVVHEAERIRERLPATPGGRRST